MKNKIQRIVLLIGILILCFSKLQAQYSGGNGTKDNPYQIKYVKDLITLSDSVNAGNSYANTYFKLINNIDSNCYLKPIGIEGGYVNDPLPYYPFEGIFDGNNNKILNLYNIDGIFGTVGEKGEVIDLTIYNSKFTGLCSHNKGRIKGCASLERLANINDGIIEKSSVKYKTFNTNGSYGGIAMINNGIISECFSKGYIHSEDSVSKIINYGGIAAINKGIIKNSYTFNEINILVNTNLFFPPPLPSDYGSYVCAGVFVGENIGNIINSYAIHKNDIIITAKEIKKGAFIADNTKGNVVNSFILEDESDAGKGVFAKSEEEFRDKNMIKHHPQEDGVSLSYNQENSPWVQDSININNGYPILKWQLERDNLFVTTYNATKVDKYSAMLNAEILIDTSFVLEKGFEYKKEKDSIWNRVLVYGDSLFAQVDSLSQNTNYQVQSYVKTQERTYYGGVINFKTLKDLGVDNIKGEQLSIKLYPNPSRSNVNIVVDNFKSNTKLSVLDIQGRVIKTQTINSKETKLDVSSFAKGVYFIRIDNSVQKLIVE